MPGSLHCYRLRCSLSQGMSVSRRLLSVTEVLGLHRMGDTELDLDSEHRNGETGKIDADRKKHIPGMADSECGCERKHSDSKKRRGTQMLASEAPYHL